jgi:hypothetical protein
LVLKSEGSTVKRCVVVVAAQPIAYDVAREVVVKRSATDGAHGVGACLPGACAAGGVAIGKIVRSAAQCGEIALGDEVATGLVADEVAEFSAKWVVLYLRRKCGRG